MVDQGRPFKTVSVRAIPGQKGKDRFDRDDDRPERLCSWRCNLTALSQVHNLYFIACSEEIHIHRPTFPEQTLSSQPLLVLRLPVSRPNLHGYIDRDHPHSVNRILIDFLGHEEALLVACDDGDIIGFYVLDILKHVSPDNTVPSDIHFVRPFFHANVGMSAWGLAIHTEARLIAASANTHQVTVFALALSSTESADSPIKSREYGMKLESTDMGDNIPSIHFNNTGSDPKGQWLSICTITGDVYIWDIHRAGLLPMKISVGFCCAAEHRGLRPPQCTCFDQHEFPHSMWNAVFLDPRSFKNTNRTRVALGTSVKESEYFWDISASKKDIPSGQKFLGMPRYPPGSGLTNLGLLIHDDPMALLIDNEWTEEDGTQFNLDSDVESIGEPPLVPDAGVGGGGGPPEEPPMQSPLDGNSSPDPPGLLPGPDVSSNPDESILEISIDMGFTGTNFSAPRSREKRPYLEQVDLGSYSSEYPDCPVLIVAKKDIFLLQSITKCDGRVGPPVIALHDPLFQTRTVTNFERNHDRMSFLEQIPELGVIIVASSLGRAAVLTLTQIPNGHTKESKSQVFGFRLDHLLPFPEQEKQGFHGFGPPPGGPLIGIAVSPVQGMLGAKEGPRYWRLMLYYKDHTVLAYEIGKTREPQNQGVEALVL